MARVGSDRALTIVGGLRILIFHGYLLRGTGSNIYNASLVRALVRLGHEVHLLCQDRHAGELDFVDAVGRWDGGGLEVETFRASKQLFQAGTVPDLVERRHGVRDELVLTRVGRALDRSPSLRFFWEALAFVVGFVLSLLVLSLLVT